MSCLLAFVAAAQAWELLGSEGAPTGRVVSAADVFASSPTPKGAVQTDSAALYRAASTALQWMDAHPDDGATRAGVLSELGVTREDVRRTLALVRTTAEEDLAAGRPSRLADPAFLAETFVYWRWTPDVTGAKARKLDLGDGRIRLTRYFVPEVDGSTWKHGAHDVALYADPGEPWRSSYTRAQVFAGVFEAGGAAEGKARALAWLTRENAHDAMMQGTMRVNARGDDGLDTASLLLNVHVPNGMAYKPNVASEYQTRLWYFREVDGIYGWGNAEGEKVRLEAGVSVAGDVWNLGFGKLVLLDHPDGKGGNTLRLALVGDTGGAFQPNLFQLDWLAGSFPNRDALYAATAGLPERVGAGVLVAR